MYKTLVLGASLKLNRYSNLAVHHFIENGIDVVGVGRVEGKIENVKIFKGQPIIKNIHTISMYLNAKNQEPYLDYIISLKPKRIIFNPGSYNSKLEEILIKYGIAFEKSCTLVLLSTNQY